MTNVKRQWETAVRTDQTWPSGSRVVRGTLLALTVVMRPDGVIRHLPRDVLAARVGLPRRTLERHLARAVEMGWLAHRRAHRHVVAEYRAAIPPSQHAKSGMHRTDLCMPPTRVHRSGLCMPPGGALYMKENSVSASEHVAVHEGREQRTEHDGSRVSLDHNDKGGSNEKMPGTRLPVGAAVALDPARTQPQHPDPRSLTRPLVGAAVAHWEPTRPIGPIVMRRRRRFRNARAREAAA